ncbi:MULTISPECIES: pentapeptide repeat-containing protein [unclassified Streptomyces]|uniref:pentapeptide repeat-containing protein n=1 Tax=unclassified Streptomyces TaxID=2593676 RepID=UPI0035E107CA
MADRGARWQRGLRLWPVGGVLALVFLAAVAVAGGVFWSLVELLGVRQLKTETQLTSRTLFDLVKLSFGVVAGSGALVALVVAYRRQRVDEDGALREATRLHTERFTAAVSQLGDASAAVRLGGVHALSGLADDAPTKELRQTCIDVLCAYLRLPYAPDPGPDSGDPATRHNYLSLREVRHTIIRLIRDHLSLPADDPRCWQGHDLDFTNVVFDGGALSGARFTGGWVSFRNAVFSGRFSVANTEFTGGSVSFTNAQFTGGGVNFSNSTFSGSQITFIDAQVSGAEVSFLATQFSGGRIYFDGAQVSDGQLDFRGAQFIGAEITFDKAEFTGGQVDFQHAQFTGGKVDLRRTIGDAPIHLPTEDGRPLPPSLLLPERWSRPAT